MTQELVNRIVLITVMTAVFIIWSYVDTVIIMEYSETGDVTGVLRDNWIGITFVFATTIPVSLAYATIFKMVNEQIWLVGLAIGCIGQFSDCIGTYWGSRELPSGQEALALVVMLGALIIGGWKS